MHGDVSDTAVVTQSQKNCIPFAKKLVNRSL